MTQIVRVARDGSSVIVKRGDNYTEVSSDLSLVGESDSLSALTSSGSWRRPVPQDYEKHSSALLACIDPSSTKRSERKLRIPQSTLSMLSSLSDANIFNKTITSKIKSIIASGSANSTDFIWISEIITEAKKTFSALESSDTSWVDKQNSVVDRLSDTLLYFAVSDIKDSTSAYKLIAVPDNFTDEDIVFSFRPEGLVTTGRKVDEYDAASIIPIDYESAKCFAQQLISSRGTHFDISSINTDERNLFELAYSELDFGHIDRISSIIADATGYSPIERSVNAQRQRRSNDGRFGGEQAESIPTQAPGTKSKLSQELPLLLHPSERIDQYVASLKNEDQVVASVQSGAQPLYMAIVDGVDRTAVLDAIALVASPDGEVSAWKRSKGSWIPDEQIVADLRGVTPPAVVELDSEEEIKSVLSQIDQYDSSGKEQELVASAYSDDVRKEYAKKGIALPDGSYPIKTVEDLKNAIQAYGRSKEEKRASVRRHIRKRANALNRNDLVPSQWKELEMSDLSDQLEYLSPLYGPYGEIIASGVPGIADTPKDMQAVRRLKNYWLYGEGGAKINWANPEGNMTRCIRHLSKYMPGRAAGYCQELHKEFYGGKTNRQVDKAAGI